jgi:hypothetical protein
VDWTDILQMWTCGGLFPVSFVSTRSPALFSALQLLLAQRRLKTLMSSANAAEYKTFIRSSFL